MRVADALSASLAASAASPAGMLRADAVQYWLLDLVAAELATLAAAR